MADTLPSAAAAAAWEPRYQPIADTKLSRTRVCLFAVVARIGAAVPSRGSDFTITLRIADESCVAGVSVTFFAKKESQLPLVKSTGDVISLHKVEIKPHAGSHFFVVCDKNSPFALFESNKSAGCCPYQTHEKYLGSDRDKDLLTQKRTWLQGLQNNNLGLRDLELELRALKSDSTFDLVCKVVHVLEHNGRWIFYVWDGTDTPPAEFQTISDAEEVASPPLLEEPPLSREVLCEMPRVGSVLRIFSDSSLTKIPLMQKGIYWARFCNITCKQELGIWKGIFGPSSRVHLLSLEDASVVDRIKMFDIRDAKKVRHRPMTSVVPANVTDCKEGGYSTLMESLANDEVTHKVKTLVRVVAAYPCEACEDHFIRLILEDPTARIHACVHKDDLDTFFGGRLTDEWMIKKMKKLLGVPEAEDSSEVAPLTRNPPWTWCCLKSYYLHKNDPWGSRRYELFGTTIRD